MHKPNLEELLVQILFGSSLKTISSCNKSSGLKVNSGLKFPIQVDISRRLLTKDGDTRYAQ